MRHVLGVQGHVQGVGAVPDLATCAACLAELRNPGDRRFEYSFLNCADCGPRYSITRALPYDREHTTMTRFRMCAPCAKEHADPGSRRFHAQPNACPTCGPRLWAEPGAPDAVRIRVASRPGESPVLHAARVLRAGGIVALKGLGGFQLACDACSSAAVERLRARKQLPAKPLGVMYAQLQALERDLCADAIERAALTSERAPIVLLTRRDDARLAAAIAPGLREVGAMLPCTPLHHRLLEAFGGPLVMTSGNRSDEPLAASNEEARGRLAPVADLLLLHDRGIHARIDDSVVHVVQERERVLRRARGFVPEIVPLPFEAPPVLAVGGDRDNAPCLCEGYRAVLGPHTGALGSWPVTKLFRETCAHLQALLEIRPIAVAHDLHPDDHSTRLAHETGLPTVSVQHHHAHVAACLVENGRRDRVIGVAWDGAGYGIDGEVWGGEFLVADLDGFERHARLRPVPLPGGTAAIREPWRMAVVHALASGLPARCVDAEGVERIEALSRSGAGAGLTSSAGRLLDAVAALLGVRSHAQYEGQAAAELEALCEGTDVVPAYPMPISCPARDAPLELDPRPLIRAVVRDRERGRAPSWIGRRVHAALASGIARSCRKIRDRTGLATVALTGGCFQNRLLLVATVRRLSRAGFEVLLHADVPAGDGGIGLGQAAVAAWRLRDASGHSR